MKGYILASDDVEDVLSKAQAAPKTSGLKDGAKPDLIDPKTVPYGTNNPILKNVSFEFSQWDYTGASLRFFDSNNERWRVPDDLVNKADAGQNMKMDMNGFKLTKEPFGFEFKDDRKDDGDLYLSTVGQSLFFMDKYMQMDFVIPSQRLFGLGERNREFQLSEGTWTMWANGQETPYDDGSGYLQTYGVHPFLLFQTNSTGSYAGMFFRNSNA